MRWPALTLLGITCAVVIGITHAALARATDCILGTDDILPKDFADAFGLDGYGPV